MKNFIFFVQREIEWKIFKGFGHMKRLSIITQFKTEFLLPFTACRKVPVKTPVRVPQAISG